MTLFYDNLFNPPTIIFELVKAMAWSIREAAWSYERAASQYARAGLLNEAEEMRRCGIDLNLHLALPVDGLAVPPAHLREALAQ